MSCPIGNRRPTSADGPVIDMGDLTLLTMPGAGSDLVALQDDMGAPAQELSSNGVELSVPEGTYLELDFEDVVLGNRRFRARDVPTELLRQFAPDDNLTALWAFYPFEAAFRPGPSTAEFARVGMSFPNPSDLAAGTSVEILSHGSFLYPDIVTPAAFEVVATATVSEDGRRIVIDEGEGIEVLTWVGYRPAG
ncbi:MAG: hypothetical protein AAGA56_25585 [Myxococcota bacterium]